MNTKIKLLIKRNTVYSSMLLMLHLYLTKYKYKPADINLDDTCDTLTLVLDLTATGLVGTGDLAWSNGNLFWTAADPNLGNPPTQLVEIDINAGTYTIHPLVDNLGANLTDVNAVFNDAEGNLIWR